MNRRFRVSLFLFSVLAASPMAYAVSLNAPSSVRQTIFASGRSENGSGVFRFDLDHPDQVEDLVPFDLVNGSSGIALDTAGERIYWIADTEFNRIDRIRRSRLDGTEVEVFITPAGQPADVEIDSVNSRLYWTERFTNTINVIDLDGTDHRVVLSTDEPRGMDLDLANGHIYWVELSSNRLRRALVDGTQIEDIITTGMDRPFDVTVDPANNRLYWAEVGFGGTAEGRVWTAALDGTNPMLIADKQTGPTDILLDRVGNQIIWNSGGSLYRAALNGTDVRVIDGPLRGYDNLVLLTTTVPEPGTLGVILCAIGIAVYPASWAKYWPTRSVLRWLGDRSRIPMKC